jgi:hypothetical protein
LYSRALREYRSAVRVIGSIGWPVEVEVEATELPELMDAIVIKLMIILPHQLGCGDAKRA